MMNEATLVLYDGGCGMVVILLSITASFTREVVRYVLYGA